VASPDGSWHPDPTEDKFRDLFIAFRLAKRPVPPAPRHPAAAPPALGLDAAERGDTLVGDADGGAAQTQQADAERPAEPAAAPPASEPHVGCAAGTAAKVGQPGDPTRAAGGPGAPGVVAAGGAKDAAPGAGAGTGAGIGLDALDGLYGDEPVDGSRCGPARLSEWRRYTSLCETGREGHPTLLARLLARTFSLSLLPPSLPLSLSLLPPSLPLSIGLDTLLARHPALPVPLPLPLTVPSAH
jgi:hypothetical protein